MDLRNQSCSSSWLPDLPAIFSHVKNFNVGHHLQTFQPDLFLPFMLTGIIDVYHHMPLLVTLTLTGSGVTRSMQSKTCCHSSHTFEFIRLKFQTMLKRFKLNILMLLLSETKWIKGDHCCFTDLLKLHSIGMHSDIFILICCKRDVMIDPTELCILFLV